MEMSLESQEPIIPADDISAPVEDGEECELYEHFRFVADKGQQLLCVDKFLVERL